MNIPELEQTGVAVLRQVLPRHLVEGALRAINLDWAYKGISAREVEWWRHDACWFPHLRFAPPMLALRDCLPNALNLHELVPCEPQIMAGLPTEPGCRIVPHTDQEPPWAKPGQKYRLIIGIPLTPSYQLNGGLAYWPLGTPTTEPPLHPSLEPGDVLLMDPRVEHGSGINSEGNVRWAIYYRFLSPA